MERLLEIVRKVADYADVFARETMDNSVSFENAGLKEIDSKLQSGVALRLFKNGQVGTAYTMNLIDREGLVDNALASLKGGVEAKYDLPLVREIPKLASYDPGIEAVTNTRVVDECTRICDYMAGRTKGQVNAAGGIGTERIRVLNTLGTDLVSETSGYYSYVSVSYPGTYSSVTHLVAGKGFLSLPDSALDFVLSLYERSQEPVACKSGRMKVLFLSSALYALIWRLTEAANGKTFYEKISPIRERVGERIFSEKLTISDESLEDSRPNARAFDDEGTPCRNLPIVEQGVFKGCYCDRYHAQKLGLAPTGHGYKGDVQFKPHPELNHLTIKPGDKSLTDLLGMMDRGIIVGGVMGAHSGNILNGDFSVGLAPGILVENGEVRGQVKDAMVSGNIYETMKNVIALENEVHPVHMGMLPAVLFDDVNVATRE